jgi:hypothetical protein
VSGVEATGIICFVRQQFPTFLPREKQQKFGRVFVILSSEVLGRRRTRSCTNLSRTVEGYPVSSHTPFSRHRFIAGLVSKKVVKIGLAIDQLRR